jgi:hypothetical protein
MAGRALDRAALIGLALGLALYVLPFWRAGRLRVAFWTTLLATLLHVYTSHQQGEGEPRPESQPAPEEEEA